MKTSVSSTANTTVDFLPSMSAFKKGKMETVAREPNQVSLYGYMRASLKDSSAPFEAAVITVDEEQWFPVEIFQLSIQGHDNFLVCVRRIRSVELQRIQRQHDTIRKEQCSEEGTKSL